MIFFKWRRIWFDVETVGSFDSAFMFLIATENLKLFLKYVLSVYSFE